MDNLYSMADVVRKTGVPYWRFYYAERTGALPEPRRLGRNRFYTESDLRRIREYFAGKGGDRD